MEKTVIEKNDATGDSEDSFQGQYKFLYLSINSLILIKVLMLFINYFYYLKVRIKRG